MVNVRVVHGGRYTFLWNGSQTAAMVAVRTGEKWGVASMFSVAGSNSFLGCVCVVAKSSRLMRFRRAKQISRHGARIPTDAKSVFAKWRKKANGENGGQNC